MYSEIKEKKKKNHKPKQCTNPVISGVGDCESLCMELGIFISISALDHEWPIMFWRWEEGEMKSFHLFQMKFVYWC